MFKQTLHILSHAAIALCALLMCFSCIDNRIDGGAYVPQPDEEGNITLQFNTYIPGMKTASRAAGDVDEQITSLDLYLFDNKGGFTGIASAQFTHGNGQYNEEYSSTTGTYTVTIPGNTEYIHFLGNYNAEEEGFNVAENMGRTEAEVIATLVTTQRIYWGRHTLQEINGDSTVVLYRNYAKVKASTTEESGVEIQGWTLYREPQYGTVAPFDVKKLDNEKDPFAFELGTTGTILPPHAQCITREHNAGNQQAAKENITASSGNTAYWMFEHKDSEFDARVFAIFLIKKGEETRYYKIEILEDTKESEGGVVIERTPYDIKRNHEYTIHFKNINPDLGYNTFEEAVMHGPANNTSIDIEETIPEIVSAKHTMRIEESDNGSTIRYYKDYTGTETYTIDNILIYYDGDDCTANGSALYEKALTASWEEEMPGANDDFTFTKVDGKEHTYRLSFTTTGFSEGENGANHYKMGLIRIREEHEHLLSRFVRVYLGPAISFRPLLISSDIPAVTDERLTILFEIPDETYLPTDLYPIEVRFGSDRVDVEKNLAIESMKIEFDASPYENVLQYTGESNGTYSWQANKTVNNTWGYKFVYTIEQAPQTKDEQKRRVTLRTVNNLTDDFSVLMEGMSTVTGTAIFNKRELEFKMQEESFNRIMLPNGLPETRYVTGYINAVKGAEEISVSYQLGTYDESQGITTADNASATIWVHYNPDELTPKGMTGTGYKDAEGNYFFVHQATSAKDTLTFTPNGEIKNSVVFLTARSNSKYGTYNSRSDYYQMNANGEIEGYGEADYLYTGVNATPYRSAAAIVSVMDEWEFNPAPSATGTSGSYSYANEIAIASGSGSKLYLRIDRPMGQDGVKLKFDTEGKFNLMESEDYTIEEDGTVTLKQNTTSEYCYLTFQATGFNSACTIKMSSVSGSSIPYAPAELTVINSSISFLGFAFANENLLSDSDAISYNDSVNKVLPIKGALLGIRIFLPATMMDQGAFRFNLTSAKFRPVNNESELTTTLTNAARFDYYSVTPSSRNNTTSIISVNENALHADESDNTRCYLDILVETLGNDGTESIKFLGTNEKNDDISFYPYNVSISTQNATYEATVMHSADNSNWTENALSGIQKEDPIYYQISLPDLGLERKNIPITIVHNGYLKLPANSTFQDTDSDANTLTFAVQSTANNNTVINIPLTAAKDLTEGETANITLDMGGDVVELGEATLKFINLTPITVSKWEIDGTDITNATNYLSIPAEKEKEVTLTITSKELAGQAVTYTIKSTIGGATTDNKEYTKNALIFADTSDTITVNHNEDGVATLKLKTVNDGTAELISIEGHSNIYKTNVKSLIIASVTSDKISKYEAYFGENATKKGNNYGKDIFDFNTNVQAFTSISKNDTTYYYASKINGAGRVSFYAPHDNMTLVLGAAVKEGLTIAGGFMIYKDADETNVINKKKDGSIDDGSDRITKKDSITEVCYQLQGKGLYTIKRNQSGNEFPLYYIKLSVPSISFGNISWQATNTNASLSNSSNPIWSGNVTEQKISVSDFAEELKLTISDLLEATELTLSSDAYTFKDNDSNTLTVTPENGTASVTLVPIISGSELVDGSFTLSGKNSNTTFTEETIAVYIRPYVQYSTDLNYNNQTSDKKRAKKNIGETITMTVKMTDEQHVGKKISFSNDIAYNDNGYLKYTSNTPYSIENGLQLNDSLQYTWIVENGPGDPILQIRGGEADVFDGSNNLYSGKQNIWPYIRTLADSFKNSDQGYIQYSTDGTNWEYVHDTNGAKLDAQYEDKDNNSEGSYLYITNETYYIRITIPTGTNEDDVNATIEGTQSATITKHTTTEKGWATFVVTNSTIADEIYNISFNSPNYIKSASAKTYVKVKSLITVTWPFNGQTDHNDSTVNVPNAFNKISVNIGDIEITGTGKRSEEPKLDGITFIKLKPSGRTKAVEWSVKPTAGTTFIPTKVSAYIQRFGTDVENGVKVKASILNGDTINLGTYTAPRSNKTQETDTYGKNENYTHQFEIILAEKQRQQLTSSEGFTLSATVGVGTDKEGGFSNVQIQGIINTIE